MSSAQAVGFWRGFSSLFVALKSLLRAPSAWPFALVPVVIFFLLEAGFVSLSWLVVKPWVDEAVTGPGRWRELSGDVASWASFLLTAALGWVVSAFFVPPLSAPALERLVAIVEAELAVPERAPLGVLAELWCGLRSSLVSSAISLPLILALTLLELLVPPIAIVATPLKLLIGALGVAWGLFDYPMTLRGIGVRQRFAFINRHAAPVLGFGTAFALVFWLPCCGVLLLPVGVIAATRLFWQIERAA